MVDTPFTTFAFVASGAPTARTMPARLSDVINVLDWGANNNGVTECSAEIQAAWNYAATISLGNGRAAGSTLYFPAGAYVCDNRLIDPCASVSFKGAGSNSGFSASNIYSTGVSGFLVDSPDYYPNFTRANATSYIGGCSVIWNSGRATSCTSSGDVLTTGGSVTGAFTVGRGLNSDDGKLYRRYITADLGGGQYRMDAAPAADISSPTGVDCCMVTSCLRSGTTAGSIPSTVGKVRGDSITDGSVTWEVQYAYPFINGSLNCIEDLGIENHSTDSDDGALRIDRLAAGVFKNVRCAGSTAIHCSGNQFGSTWIGVTANTSFADVGRAGTYGFMMGQATMIDCAVNGFGVGVASYGSNFAMYGGHIETNTTGILLGMDPTGASSPAHGCTLHGLSFERNATSINMQNCSNPFIMGNNMTGTIGPDGVTPIVTGLLVGTISGGGLIQNNSGGSTFSNAAFDFSAANGESVGVMFNGGSSWLLPAASAKADFHFLWNGVEYPLTYAQLPGQSGVHNGSPLEGQEFYITDAFGRTAGTSTASSISGTTLTVGGTVTGRYSVGDTLIGTGVTTWTKIVGYGTPATGAGTPVGGAGTYEVYPSHSPTGTVAINAYTLPLGDRAVGGGGFHAKVRYNSAIAAWTILGA